MIKVISLPSIVCVLIAVFVSSAGLSRPSLAQGTADQIWRFAVVVGEVRARPLFSEPSRGWVSVVNGDRVGAGSRIETGDRSHALITNGRDSMTLQENTMLTLPAIGERGAVVIRQRSGTVSYDVGRRNAQTGNFLPGTRLREAFQIRTPFLATLVKGTKFIITVSDEEETFEVIEGVVGITDFTTARITNIRPRQIATKLPNVALDVGLVRRARLVSRAVAN